MRKYFESPKPLKEFLKCYEMSDIPNLFTLLHFQAAFEKMFGNTEISDNSKDFH